MCLFVRTEINFIQNTRTVKTALKHFVSRFVSPSHFDAYVVIQKMFRDSIVLSVASQQSNLWRNVS